MPLLFLTLLGLLVAAAGVFQSVRLHKLHLVFRMLLGTLIWLAAYLALLVGASLTSRERVLGWHKQKRFCGLYLDCHLAASVENVSQARAIGSPPNLLEAVGTFYTVTLKISSDAKRATLHFRHPSAIVIDRDGKEYSRSLEAERILELSRGRTVPFEQPVAPQAGYFTKDLVFDLPADVQAPTLLLSAGHWSEQLIELAIIGDEDSWLHSKTLFRLHGAGPANAEK